MRCIHMLCCIILGDVPPDNLPPFSSIPLRTMYLTKGDTAIAGCSQRSETVGIPISWAFENTTEILVRGIPGKVFEESEIPLSTFGDFNLLIDSNQYDFHNTTVVCQFNTFFDGLLQNPVTFFVYGKLSQF